MPAISLTRNCALIYGLAEGGGVKANGWRGFGLAGSGAGPGGGRTSIGGGSGAACWPVTAGVVAGGTAGKRGGAAFAFG